MDLVELLDRKWIKPELRAESKVEAVKELVDLLAAHGAIEQPERALEAVLAREKVRTTGIGQGIALPHGKVPFGADPVIAIGIKPGGIDFDSVDGRPADIIVLMISPADQIARHIQALARVSRFLSFDGFRRNLRQAKTADEIYDTVARKEADATVGE